MRAVIFDLDGTLIDSDPDISAALNRVLAAEGLETLSVEEVKRMIGDGAKVLVQRAFAARGAEADTRHVAAFLADYEANAVVNTVPYAGIPAVLRGLQAAGHPLAVCTNKPIWAARRVLAALDLAGYFPVVLGGDSTPWRKPDPRHLAATIEALGAAPENAVMIGDHENDMLAAGRLGVPGIFVTWGYGLAEAPFVAHAPADLPGLIAGMG
jgi:phosphoglycolate phosphatase